MDAATLAPHSAYALPALLHIIGRGARGSRDLGRDQARDLMHQLLDGSADLSQTGAALMALRLKGETAEELTGFADALRPRLPQPPLHRPAVVLASVNGARKLPNLVPLLALLLRQHGVPLLVIGHEQADGRMHTATLWARLRLPFADSAEQAATGLNAGEAVYLPLAAFSPELAALLDLRQRLGVRNIAHTLVKLIAPLRGPHLLLAGYTHAAYAPLMQETLDAHGSAALLLHGCEGEAVPHPSRATTLLPSAAAAATGVDCTTPLHSAPVADPLPDGTDAASCAAWSEAVASGHVPAPPALDDFTARVARTALRLGASPAPAPSRSPQLSEELR
ncbi:DNA-binding protein YbiB [Thiomonas sp.]|uniref:DNA-binding protein YbiB n=1 Tax=Thiomonas sp. TaxID=2047785 RepID=UPI002617C18A|nr:DNA-binding protein YbiB [Thiomonas sp.]